MAPQPHSTAATTKRVGLRDRARYHFDNLLSRGTWAVLLFLGTVTFIGIALSALLVAIAGVDYAGSDGSSLLEDFWQSMLRAIDPGTMADDVGWGHRLLALAVTLFGILIAGTLIGLIANGVEQRVEEMQRGRSAVIESDHILILGASPRLPVMVNQLTLASRKQRRNTIVVLADRDPREMRDDVRSLVPDTRGSRLVFRWGDPSRRADLAMVRADRARSVIVVADEDAESDAGVVKATLAVGAEIGGFDRVPIVAELSDLDSAESLLAACGGEIHPIVPQQSIGRITAFTLREPGLTRVVEELLDFRGCDLYLRPVGRLAGSSFGEVVTAFTRVRPIGVMGPEGGIEINPPAQAVLADGHRLIVLAEDADEASQPESSEGRRTMAPTTPPPFATRAAREHLVVIGWNPLGARLIDQLADVVAPGSSVEVVFDSRLFDPEELPVVGSEKMAVTLTPTSADTWLPDDDRFSAITSIIVLGYRRGTTVEEADSRTLLNVMLLKLQIERRGGVGPRVVAELLNADNVDLARMTGADDFLVSDAIASRFITQLAEQPARRDILLSLYAPEGPSVHLAEAQELGANGRREWGEIVDVVYSQGLLAIGWRRAAVDGGQVVLNPDLTAAATLEPKDHVIVIG